MDSDSDYLKLLTHFGVLYWELYYFCFKWPFVIGG